MGKMPRILFLLPSHLLFLLNPTNRSLFPFQIPPTGLSNCFFCKNLIHLLSSSGFFSPTSTGKCTLGVAPSQDASGKWRFVGIPYWNVIILVVTVTGKGPHPNYTAYIKFTSRFFSDFTGCSRRPASAVWIVGCNGFGSGQRPWPPQRPCGWRESCRRLIFQQY